MHLPLPLRIFRCISAFSSHICVSRPIHIEIRYPIFNLVVDFLHARKKWFYIKHAEFPVRSPFYGNFQSWLKKVQLLQIYWRACGCCCLCPVLIDLESIAIKNASFSSFHSEGWYISLNYLKTLLYKLLFIG